jgi:RNA-binding protein
MQTLQKLYPTRNQLPRTHTTKERTTRRNHMPQMRQTHENPTSKKRGKTQTMNEQTAGKKRRIKRKLGEEKPTIRIGKGGASQDLLNEIEKQLDKEETVKVKMLKSALAKNEAKQIASKVAEQTAATLVEVRGHTFILYKHRKK